MILLKKYQDEAVNDLSEKLYKLLKKPNARHNLIFKAPTGAGKTIMMAAFLNRIAKNYQNVTNSKNAKQLLFGLLQTNYTFRVTMP